MMRKIFVVGLLCLFLCAVAQQGYCAEKMYNPKGIPNMVGKWTSIESFIVSPKVDLKKVEPCKTNCPKSLIVIEQQKGCLLKGYKEYIRPNETKTVKEPFCGVFSKDGQKIYLGDSEAGYSFIEMLSNTQFVMYYIEDGKNYKAVSAIFDKTP